MNDSEHDFISSEVLTNFGKSMGQSDVDPDRLREVLTLTIAQHSDQAQISTLRDTGAHFRNEIVGGRGGNQILLEDPSGNPIELFEPPRN